MEKFNDKWFRIIGIPAVAIVAQTLFFPSMVFSGRYPLGKLFGISILIAIIIWEGNRQVLIAVRRRYPELKNTWKRLLNLFFSMAITTAVLSSTIVYITGEIQLWGYRTSWRHHIINFVIRFSLVILLAAIYEGVYFFQQWKQIYRETLKLKRKNLQKELDALITQVNPHLLFQSLNSLSAIMAEDKKLAIRFVDELSQVYRYLLQNNEREWVSLDSELRFVESYLFILKVRFGQGLIYK